MLRAKVFVGAMVAVLAAGSWQVESTKAATVEELSLELFCSVGDDCPKASPNHDCWFPVYKADHCSQADGCL